MVQPAAGACSQVDGGATLGCENSRKIFWGDISRGVGPSRLCNYRDVISRGTENCDGEREQHKVFDFSCNPVVCRPAEGQEKLPIDRHTWRYRISIHDGPTPDRGGSCDC